MKRTAKLALVAKADPCAIAQSALPFFKFGAISFFFVYGNNANLQRLKPLTKNIKMALLSKFFNLNKAHQAPLFTIVLN
jgi:hypothetical protein